MHCITPRPCLVLVWPLRICSRAPVACVLIAKPPMSHKHTYTHAHKHAQIHTSTHACTHSSVHKYNSTCLPATISTSNSSLTLTGTMRGFCSKSLYTLPWNTWTLASSLHEANNGYWLWNATPRNASLWYLVVAGREKGEEEEEEEEEERERRVNYLLSNNRTDILPAYAQVQHMAGAACLAMFDADFRRDSIRGAGTSDCP